jgi:choline-sulfatase
MDVLKMLRGECAGRQNLIGIVEPRGSHDFKLTVVTDEWKYIFMANGGREQLFNLRQDPNELLNCVASASGITDDLYALAVQACRVPGAMDALDGESFGHFLSANAHGRASVNSTGRTGWSDSPLNQRTH